MSRHRIERITARPLSVPLTSPFVIASARVDVTPNVLVEVEVVDAKTGARAIGLGESATLHPVTSETQQDLLTRIAQLATPSELSVLDALHGSTAQGLSMAVEDALARLEGRTLRSALAGNRPVVQVITTDITLPIGEPAAMAQLARERRTRGFTCFKVKVGKDVEGDLRALEQIHRAVPDATFRIDANAAFTAAEAISLAKASERLGLVVECFEQPTAAANVAAALGGVEYPDLDTALLLATDPFSGGYVMTGARLELARGPGLDLRPA